MCNLNCKICFRNSWIDEKQGVLTNALTDKLYDSIINTNDLEKVVFGGMGEPLIHAKICDMINRFSQMNKNTQIITNAVLLDENMSEGLLDAGLGFLWVSIDDSHIKSADKKSKLIFENIRYFNSIRGQKCKLGFTFVLNNTDNDTLDKIQHFATDFSADEINLSQIIPSEYISGLKYNEHAPIGVMKPDNIESKQDRRLNYCPFIEEGACFVKWNGDVTACMQLLHSSYTYLFDEKRKVMAYSFGNINNKSLQDIWNSREYVQFREKVRKFEFPDCTLCDGCDDRKENKTDCMYNEMPTCGACLWAQNIARCP